VSSGQIPPWIQEQLIKLQQTQQSLQSIVTQRQNLEIEKRETEKALDELKKASDMDAVFKHAGTILVKSTKQEMIDELEERQEMTKTRSTVLTKQEDRVKEILKEQEAKVTEMMKGRSAETATSTTPAPPAEENPRK